MHNINFQRCTINNVDNIIISSNLLVSCHVLGGAAGLGVGQGGGRPLGLGLPLPLDVGHHLHLVGWQTFARVEALGPHGDLVQGKLFQVVEEEGGGVGGHAVQAGEGGVVLLGLAPVHAHREDRAQEPGRQKSNSELMMRPFNHFLGGRVKNTPAIFMFFLKISTSQLHRLYFDFSRVKSILPLLIPLFLW